MAGQANTTASPSIRAYSVGGAEIRPDTNTVVLDGDERYLRQQAMQVLLYLLQRPGELVSKDVLHTAIWSDTAVTDDALVQCVVEIRKALGDDPRRPRFIRTVPKGGYCFIGPVGPVSPATMPALSPSTPVGLTTRRPARWRWAAALAAVSLIGGAAAGSNWARGSTAESVVASPAPSDQLRVIVVGFDNASGDTELDWLRRGLPEMIVTDLARSPGLNVVTPDQLSRAAGRDLSSHDLTSALAAARQIHADAIVTGRFSAVGEALRVDARVHKADGTLIGSESLTAARREVVLVEVDRLAEGLSRVMGRPLNAQQSASRLSDVMTGDLSAFREYSLGVERTIALQWNAALTHFEAAVKADPTFAMAHARIGYTYAVTMGWPQRGEAYLAKAFQLSERLTEKDRLSILAWYALAKLDYAGAISPLRQIIDRFPDDLENYRLLSRTLRGEERWDEALAVIQRGLRVNPNAKDLHNELFGLYGLTWRLAEALAAAQKYVALAPLEPNAHDSLGLAFQQAGRYAQALESYQRAVALDPAFDIAVFHIGNVYAEQGRYREAAAAYQRHVDMMRFPEMKQRGYSAQGWLYYQRGDLDTAWQLMTKLPSGDGPRADLAIVSLARGDRRRLDAERRRPSNASNRGTRPSRILDEYLRGLAAQADGQPEAALDAFRQATKHAPMAWSFPTFDDALAQALFDNERFAEAEAEYERLLTRNPSAARYQYRLAQIAERLGRRAQAAEAYRKFLALWATADPDLPEIVRARARLNATAHATSDR